MEANEDGAYCKGLVEAFSNGVFAIIVTLLVLELLVPVLSLSQQRSAPALATALLALLPKFAGWVISFFVVCAAWANHYQVLGVFQRLYTGVYWLNAHLLQLCLKTTQYVQYAGRQAECRHHVFVGEQLWQSPVWVLEGISSKEPLLAAAGLLRRQLVR